MKKETLEERLELLNSVADDIVEYMNKSFKESRFGIEALSFGSQKGYKEGTNDIYANFDFGYSPTGEDLTENIIYFDGSLFDLREKLQSFADDFDIDESVEIWLQAKWNGMNDVPSAVDLVHDAEAKQEFFNSLFGAIDCFPATLSAKVKKVLTTPFVQENKKEKSNGGR